MPHPAVPSRAVRAFLLLSLAALIAGAAPASGHARRARRAHTPATRPAPPPLVTVTVEPETGALVPGAVPAPSDLAERTGLSRSAEGLREVRLAGGGVMVDLQGRFMEYALVRLGPDGCPVLGCVDGPPLPLEWWGVAPLRPATPMLEVR